MNTKILQIIYGIALLIILPLAAFMFLTNHNLKGDTKKQTERLDAVEGKVFQLETINKILQKQVEEAGRSQKEASPVAQVKPQEEKPTTPDKKTVRIQVLNARGLQGVAAAVEAKLTPAGFIVSNKDNTRWQATSTLTARQGFEVSANEIMNLLKSEYGLSKVDPLPVTVTDYDIVITIGSK